MIFSLSFSASSITESRCSGVPASTFTSHVPQTPLRHDPLTGIPPRSSASSTVSSAPTVSANGLRLKVRRSGWSGMLGTRSIGMNRSACSRAEGTAEATADMRDSGPQQYTSVVSGVTSRVKSSWAGVSSLAWMRTRSG